jgi:hypothetical protein
VKTSVKTSKLKIYAKNGAFLYGPTVTTESETYVWVDLGTLPGGPETGEEFEIHAWLSAAGTLSVDRIEMFHLEDRAIIGPGIFRGCRDLGQSVLYDSRVQPTVVVR